ncbi:hypothetical protein FACS1894120_4730 [Clostridia bacterium]|nr:hypothetical protein FACS1894120_4730 [Clostridia bacterium]
MYTGEKNYAASAPGGSGDEVAALAAALDEEVSDIDRQAQAEQDSVSEIDRINIKENFRQKLETMDNNKQLDYFLVTPEEMNDEQRSSTLNSLVDAMVDLMLQRSEKRTVAKREVEVIATLNQSQLTRLRRIIFNFPRAMKLSVSFKDPSETESLTDASELSNNTGPREYKLTLTYYCVARLVEPQFVRNLRIKKLQDESNISEADAEKQLEQQDAEEATSTFDAVAEVEAVYDSNSASEASVASATGTVVAGGGSEPTAAPGSLPARTPSDSEFDDFEFDDVSVPKPREDTGGGAVGSVSDDDGSVETVATAA